MLEELFPRRVPCGNFTKENVTSDKIVVSGWVYHYRDQGGVIFIDLRDRSGILQLVFDKSTNEKLHAEADTLRSEDVILVEGVLRQRDKDSINPKMPTGEVELVAEKLFVLSKCNHLPMPVDEYERPGEDTRLKYRFLDLRRREMQEALQARHQFIHAVRMFLDKHDFWEIETPILNKSTPEGARDFLVPSRLHPGHFYALPQSPQIFKQILMVGGAERYYQIARCFRDEDLRKDRQPEFTQIDLEMSFVSQQQVMEINEKMILSSLKETFGIEASSPVEVLSYEECMENYGTDRPDTRYDLKLTELGDWAHKTEFQVFKKAVEKGGRLKALRVESGAQLSRKEIDDLTEYVKQDFKAKGLAWIKHSENGLESVVAKFLPEAAQQELIERTGSKPGDIIFFAADSADIVFATLAAVRQKMAERFQLIDEQEVKILWVVDFPLFTIDSETGHLTSMHHPFTAPKAEYKNLILEMAKKESLSKEDKQELLKVQSNAYDMVLNGVEIGGGSIRIHETNLQMAIFRLLNIAEEEAQDRFGFLLEALKYGAPPHGGIAFGVDRILMLALKRSSIRDVIAFPKTQKGVCLMSNAPSPVDEKQLRELYIKSIKPAKKS